MEQTSVANLETKDSLDDSDYLVVDDLTTTKKILARQLLADCLYPVGSIYMSVNSTSPAKLFGGTWEQIKDTFLLGSGSTYTAGDTGGEAEHVLTYDELPKQGFRIPHVAYYDDTTMNLGWTASRTGMGREGAANTVENTGWHNMSLGGSCPHNNMPPYLVVYMWKRTK